MLGVLFAHDDILVKLESVLVLHLSLLEEGLRSLERSSLDSLFLTDLGEAIVEALYEFPLCALLLEQEGSFIKASSHEGSRVNEQTRKKRRMSVLSLLRFVLCALSGSLHAHEVHLAILSAVDQLL